MKKASKDNIKTFDKLLLLFKKEYNIDVLERTRERPFPQYRGLFNVVLVRKHKLTPSEISRIYRLKGWKKKSHATILNSLLKFNEYKKDNPEIENYLYDLYPEAKEKKEIYLKSLEKQRLYKITKSLKGLSDEKLDELFELIQLRKKSWEWKYENKTKKYISY